MKNYVRVVIPRNVNELNILTSNILAKDTADGVDSLLTNIDTADLAAKHAEAVEKHDLAEQISRDREQATQQRNLALGIAPQQKSYTPGTVLNYVISIRDFLLGQFKGVEQVMGDWGYEVDTNRRGHVKVIIPRNPVMLLRLANNILKKDLADDEASILNIFDMADLKEKVELAEEQDDLTRKLNRDKEKAYKLRNEALGLSKTQRRITPGTVLYYVVSVRDTLIGKFKGVEQMLGDWGFEVNVSQSPSTPTTETTVSGVVTDSVSGQIIPNVVINFHTNSGVEQAVSNAIGQYNIELDMEGSEPVTIEINHPGYMPYNVVESITAGEENTIDIELQPL